MKKSTGAILIIIIVLLLGAVGVGGFFLIKGNIDSNKAIGELTNAIAGSNENEVTTTNTENTVTNTSNTTETIISNESVVGTYKAKVKNEYSEADTLKIELCKNGQYSYQVDPEFDNQDMGYYVVENGKITLYALAISGNDVSARLYDKTKATVLTINDDGSLTDTNTKNLFKKESSDAEVTDITEYLTTKLRNNWLLYAQ